MNDSLKVQTHHLKRHAYLYIRQSSMKQVMENTESTKRQYALRQRANALGWTDDRVIVIDSDQGESGASSIRRHGFQRLVSDVGMGRAGIVMGIEVSRLARNNADRHRLLEICGLTETLILDEDGVYDPGTSSRERKRMLAYIVDDVTLLKMPKDGITKCHVRFRGGRTETFVTKNSKSSAQQVQTPSEIVALVDRLLDDYTCSEIAEILNERGFRPGGSARKGRGDDTFTVKRVNYLVHRYHLRMRYDRLRDRGYMNSIEMATRLGIHELTVVSWAKAEILKRHAYNDHFFLYQPPDVNTPPKQCSRWNTLADRLLKMNTNSKNTQTPTLEPKEV